MLGSMIEPENFDRRDFLKMTGAGALVLTMTPFAAEATPEQVLKAMGEVVGQKNFKEGRISITLPEIAENGSVVAMKVNVESPMTADDHVKAIHMFADGNPLPYIGTYELGPRNGKAEISLRIRLAKTQKIVVVAETSKGEAFLARRGIKVTLGGCGG
ncbi:MAG: thiosulfate oxidation carrier protein SoxY [Rhodospirillales bacterium]|nr:thiosulfate oxidation carrier protein SoxY [Alphaproteobacteria bacterium]MBL6948575.1 thiosulfate oxidation carrier protein SoxY [Rhodospirillales bacterium]